MGSCSLVLLDLAFFLLLFFSFFFLPFSFSFSFSFLFLTLLIIYRQKRKFRDSSDFGRIHWDRGRRGLVFYRCQRGHNFAYFLFLCFFFSFFFFAFSFLFLSVILIIYRQKRKFTDSSDFGRIHWDRGRRGLVLIDLASFLLIFFFCALLFLCFFFAFSLLFLCFFFPFSHNINNIWAKKEI
jgi:hypothetical protein